MTDKTAKPQTRFFTQADLPNIHPWPPDEWWFTDPRNRLEDYLQFLLEHGIDPEPRAISHYDDPDRIGGCGRPLWRCDLTCPDKWHTFVGPIPEPQVDAEWLTPFRNHK
ncbi:hypothetical protein [Pseudodesulfovibrio profundus]|jgi:hypothetical protein|nr:hypothetical protein [Pseudodesulfovibrio profundus]